MYNHFKLFSGFQVVGVATDQTPVYYDKVRAYREAAPSSMVGSPGHMQGLNTGVVLLDLERMRASQLYQGATVIEEMLRLEQKYNIRGTVGDQVTFSPLEDVS